MPKPLLKLVQVNRPEQTFPAVWAPYPRKESRKDALKAWCDLDPDAALVQTILATLDWQIELWASRADWYTPPLLGTYLRAERWTDEKPPTPTRNHPSGVRVLTTAQKQQQEATMRIQYLVHVEGKTKREATRIVGLEQGWITEDQR